MGDGGQQAETERNLGNKDKTGEGEEELAVARFQNVGKDAAEEGEQERKRPQPRPGDRLRGDDGEERKRDDEGGCVAEVTAAANAEIKNGGDGKRNERRRVGRIGEEATYCLEREPEARAASG